MNPRFHFFKSLSFGCNSKVKILVKFHLVFLYSVFYHHSFLAAIPCYAFCNDDDCLRSFAQTLKIPSMFASEQFLSMLHSLFKISLSQSTDVGFNLYTGVLSAKPATCNFFHMFCTRIF